MHGLGRLERRHAIGASLALLLLATNLWGFSYFTASQAVRVRHSLHDWFGPTGWIGQSLGILALLMFVFLWLYPMRKRVRWMSRMGVLSRWLDVHIVVGLTVPIVGATHAGWRFQGLIGLGYWAMLTVSLSGIVGRYLYRHIPRNRSGAELSLGEVQQRRARLVDQLAAATGRKSEEIRSLLERELPNPSISRRNYLQTLYNLVLGDFLRWRLCRRVEAALIRDTDVRLDRAESRQIVHLARAEVALTQQLRMLDATQAVFKFWHVAHLPFAVTAFVAVLVHVIVSVVLGVTWFW